MNKTLKDFHPLKLFLQELKQTSNKLEVYRALPTFIVALNQQSAVKLLPTLVKKIIQQENEQCQIQIAQRIPDLLESIGGAKQAHVLLKLLFEIYSFSDGLKWHETVFDSIRRVLLSVSIRKSENVLIKIANKIAKENAQLALRYIPELYLGVSQETQTQFDKLLEDIVRNSSPPARKAISWHLKQITKIAPPAPTQLITLMFQKCLESDDQEVLCNAVVAIPNFVYMGGNLDVCCSLLQKACENPKNKAFQKVLSQLQNLAKAMGTQPICTVIQKYLLNLKQFDAEVVVKILNECENIIKVFGLSKTSQICLPVIAGLQQGALLRKSTMGALASLHNYPAAVQVIRTVIKSVDNQYRVKFFQKLNSVSEGTMQVLISTTQQIFQSLNNWRTKVAIINAIIRLLNQLDDRRQNLVNEGLLLSKKAVADKCNATRQSGFKLLFQLLKKNIEIDNVMQQAKCSRSWQLRQGYVILLCKLIQSEAISWHSYKLGGWAFTDVAEGVRIAAGQLVKAVLEKGGSVLQQQIKQAQT